MKQACVFPVSAAAALEWAAGRLEDLDLMTRAPLVPEAVFIANLPDRRSYRDVVRQLRHWHQRGAVTMITRTAAPAVEHKLLKEGCQRTYHEATAWRFLWLPADFARWMDRQEWKGKPELAKELLCKNNKRR